MSPARSVILKAFGGGVLHRRGGEPKVRDRVVKFKPLEKLYFACLILSVVPFGAVYPFLTGLTCVCFATMTVLAQWLPPADTQVERFIARLSTLIFLLFGWVMLQSWQFTGNPLVNPIWSGPVARLTNTPGAISVNPGETRDALVTLAVPCFAALAGLRIFHDDASAMRLWRFLAQFGAILVLLTLLQSLVVPGTILIYEKWVYITDYTLTFVNRNTAATAIGVFLILNAGLLLESLKGTSFREIRLFLKVFDLKKNRKYRQILFHAVSCAVIVLGLMLTRSRGGVGSTLLAGLVLGGLALAFRPIVPERDRRTRFFVTVSICVLVVVAFLMLFGGLVVERIAQEGWEDNTRLCSYEAILKAIGDRWLLGWGFGTFVDVFPSYRDAACTGIIGIWDRAHNSYLEFIMGTGVFGAVVLVGVFWLIIAALVRGLGSRQSMNIPPCASLAILVLISLHSLVDFSLQIPGFAVLAVASLVCGVTISLKKAST